MKTNDRGIAVPSEQSPTPWQYKETEFYNEIVDDNDDTVIEDVLAKDDAKFQVVAANYHERMADIVRRLGESGQTLDQWDDIAEDAGKLWAEYQKEVQP